MSTVIQKEDSHEVHSFCQRAHTIEQPCPKNLVSVLLLKFNSVSNLTEADLKFIRSNQEEIEEALADLM